MTELDAVRQEWTQLWGELAPYWSFSPAAARVHAWLMGQVEPADTEAIMEALAMSRGAVSTACRELRDWRLIHAERQPGSRRVFFRAETDYEEIIRAIVEHRRSREWSPMTRKLADWTERLKGERAAEAREIRARLLAMQALVDEAEGLADLFLRGGTIRSFGLRWLMKRVVGKKISSST